MPSDKLYDDAIKVWLLRRESALRDAVHRHHQKVRGLTEHEIARKITDVVFGATPETWLSEMTPCEPELGVISCRYEGREYTVEIDEMPVTQLIAECVGISDELHQGTSPVLYPAKQA
jgi:hypothetical protein